MITTIRTRTALLAGTAAAATLLFAGCAQPGAAPAATAPSSDAEHGTATPRVALTYDGGILVLDGTTLALAADLPLDGFNRLNAAGDGRHVLITTAEGFRVLDTGSWTTDAGEHRLEEPELTDLVFEAAAAGHVVRHGDKTILFADGTGDTTIFESAALRETESLPPTETVASEAAHHGVAIELEDGTLLSTLGTDEGRTGIRVLDATRTEIDRSEQCPSVHGEGAAANEVAVFGCADGVLVYDDGAITKIASPDAYGRTGNQYVTETSTIAVGDYNSNPDAEGYLLSQLLLVDTVAKTSTVIDLPAGASYTWRDVARGPNDEILVLSSDGSLYVLDETTGAVTATHPVIAAWEGPVDWQDAHPALLVNGGIAYVTEPASDTVHAIDISTGTILHSAELPATPNEIAVVTG
jgi:outer membrane protein assembly factor BamB